jgi:hypothetical protein
VASKAAAVNKADSRTRQTSLGRAVSRVVKAASVRVVGKTDSLKFAYFPSRLRHLRWSRSPFRVARNRAENSASLYF